MKNLAILFALILLAGCKKDEITRLDPIRFTSDFTGDYPAEGYFTNKNDVEIAVNKMLKDNFPQCAYGSVAKIRVLFGDIMPGYQAADVTYELTMADYDSMGEESGQPGKYDNFDANMDIDAYLTAFCDVKYADLEVDKAVSIKYIYYASGTGATNKVSSYKKESSGWVSVDLGYSADMAYILETEDYDSMGTESGKPGRYDHFDANMDIDHYITVFLKLKFPYTFGLTTCEVFYSYYASGTTIQSRIYQYDGSTWTFFNPYEDTVEISTKVAEMKYNICDWIMLRLVDTPEN